MDHEAEPGLAEAVSQHTAGTGPGTARDTAPAEAGGVAGSAAAPEGAVADGGADGTDSERAAAAIPPEQTTGDARVDGALRLLDRLPGLPVSDHPELFEQVHARISEVLGELESGPGDAGPAGG